MTTEAYDDHDHDDEFDDEFEGYDEQVAESWREFTHDLAVRLGDLRFGSFDFKMQIRQDRDKTKALGF